METEQFSLCWNNFYQNLKTGFHTLLQEEDLVDVTLAVEGQFLKAHKTVLSVCSPYFKELFKANPCKHPIVILQDVKYTSLCSLLEFMYQGEVSVSQDEIPVFMKVAEMLKIKGLTENTNNPTDSNGIDDIRNSQYFDRPDSKQGIKRPKPSKRILQHLKPFENLQHLKPIETLQHLKPLESLQHLKPIESYQYLQPLEIPQLPNSPHHSLSSPPPKKICIEEKKEHPSNPPNPSSLPNLPYNTKQEPVDNDNGDDYRELDDHHLDMSAMLDTRLSEPSPSSGSWTPDQKWPTDTSSPGTLQCILGRRGNPRLIVDGHVFFKKSTYKGKSFWYCKHSRTPYKCQAVCWTYNGDIVKWPSNHSHVVIPEPFNPDEDIEVPISRLQEVLLRSSCNSEVGWSQYDKSDKLF